MASRSLIFGLFVVGCGGSAAPVEAPKAAPVEAKSEAPGVTGETRPVEAKQEAPGVTGETKPVEAKQEAPGVAGETRPVEAKAGEALVSTAPVVASDPELKGFPLGRLRTAGNPVVKLEHRIAQAKLAKLGVRTYKAFTATAPRVWLLVFEFESQAKLLEHQDEVVALAGPADGAPHYRETAHTGAWLLISGFPGEKPPSPEMTDARRDIVSNWWGRE